MSEPTRRAMRIDDYEEGTGILSLLPAAPDEIVVVVLREEEYAALTAERDELEKALAEIGLEVDPLRVQATGEQPSIRFIQKTVDRVMKPGAAERTKTLQADRDRYREALDRLVDVGYRVYRQDFTWEDFRLALNTGHEALNREK